MPNVTHTRKGKQTIHVGYIVERNSKWHFGIDISSANFFGDDERNNSKNDRSYNCNIHSKEMILFIKHRKREKRNDKVEKKTPMNKMNRWCSLYFTMEILCTKANAEKCPNFRTRMFSPSPVAEKLLKPKEDFKQHNGCFLNKVNRPKSRALS